MNFKKYLNRAANFAFAAILCAGFLALWPLSSAQAQVVPVNTYVLTNLPPVMPGGAISNLVTQAIPLRQGGGMAVIAGGFGTSATTTNSITIPWFVSRDGTSTNFTTSPAFITTFFGNGTSQIWIPTNYPVATVNNFAYATPGSVTNNNAAGQTWSNLTLTVIFGNSAYNYGQ